MDTPAPPPIETVQISRLFCSPTNPRRNDAAVPHVAASLRRFGWQQPIVARSSGEVVAGNTRLKAAQQLGMTEVPVWWFEGDDLAATAFSIADNRSHSFAQWDEPALAQLLEQLREEDALEGVGYSEDDIDELVQQLRDQEEVDKDLDDEGADEPPEVAVAKTGDLWVLGDHQLLCGDSTNLKDVQRVMGGDKAALVATDPPYLVDYTGERPNDSGKDWTDSYREIDIKDADGFFRAVFVNVLEVLGPKAAIYCWHAHKRCGDIQRIWRDLGILDHQQIIWVKPASVFGRVYWHFRHEPCVMGWRQGDMPEHDGVHDHDSVWEVDWYMSIAGTSFSFDGNLRIYNNLVFGRSGSGCSPLGWRAERLGSGTARTGRGSSRPTHRPVSTSPRWRTIPFGDAPTRSRGVARVESGNNSITESNGTRHRTTHATPRVARIPRPANIQSRSRRPYPSSQSCTAS